jgi:methionyl-tRNA formyltransferase
VLDGVRTWIYDSFKHPVGKFSRVRGKPGDIAGVTETSILINSQGGRIEVLKLRPAGGPKMNAGEFARQRKLVISGPAGGSG